MKSCNKCGVQKEFTEFSKCARRKDGLQPNCKQCNKEYRKVWYNEINPDYFWGKDGYFVRKYTEELIYQRDYKRANKDVKIYQLTLLDGSVYIGYTKRPMGVRMVEHKRHWKNIVDGIQHKSLKQMSIYYKFRDDNYTPEQVEQVWKSLKILEQFEGSRYDARKREIYWIGKLYKQKKKLVNFHGLPPQHKLPRTYKALQEILNGQTN